MARSLKCDGNDRAGLKFDANGYLERLRQVRVGSVLPSLVERYALDERHLDAADRQLACWIEDVVSLWRRQADKGVATIAGACAQFLADDEELRRKPGYRDARWWRDQIRAARPAAPGPRQPGPSGPPSPARPRPVATGDPDQPSPAAEPGSATQPKRALAPFRDVTVEQRDDRVIVRWQLSPDADAAGFMVERLAGPGIEGRRWRTAGAAFEDLNPPAGRPLEYRVTPQVPEAATQPAGIRVRVVFTPPVSGLAAAQVSNGGVTGRWRAHPGVRETQVRRAAAASDADPADGVQVPSQIDRFHDRAAPPGRHVYTVVPIYRAAGSHVSYRGRHSRVDVEVVDPPPPPRVAVEEGRHGATDVVLRWDPMPAGVSLLLRRATAEPAGAEGDVLTLEDSRLIGEPAADEETFGGTTARVTLPAGNWLLVPLSAAGSLAVRGRSIAVVVIPPVRNAEATRNGPNGLLSWEWPEGMRLARVTWRTGGVERVQEVPISEYRRLGGVPFHGSEAAEARISGVVRSGAEELVSAPVTAPVAAQAPTLVFHVHRVRPWQLRRVRPYRLHGPRWWCSTRRIVIKSDLPCAGLRLEFYARAPSGGADAEIPVRVVEDLELASGRPHELTLTLPDLSALDQPRYLACRAATMSGPVRVNEFASTGREIRPCFR